MLNLRVIEKFKKFLFRNAYPPHPILKYLKRFLSSTIWFGYNHCQSNSKNEIDVEYYKKLDFCFCVYLLFTEIYVLLCKSKPQIFL